MPFDEMVALADTLEAAQGQEPLQVQCECCAKRRNFDFLYGGLEVRMCKGSNRESKYADADSIVSFRTEVVPAATQEMLRDLGLA